MSDAAPPPTALQGRLRRLREQLHTDLEQVRSLAAVSSRWERIEELLEDLDRQVERADRHLVVALVGATGAGKSTLLNALVGQDLAREGVDRPTTREPVIHAPPGADIEPLLRGLPGPPPRVEWHAPEVASPWTRHVLVDAPDVNSVVAGHREVVAELARRSDVLVVVLHHQSVVEEAAVSFVDAFARRRRLLVVLNRADELSAAAREELLDQARRLAAGRWRAPEAPVVATSARQAKTDPDTPGWREFRLLLQELVEGGALADARWRNARGTAARIAELAAAAREEAAPELQRLPDAVAEGTAVLLERAARELEERLRLREADLAALLTAETARRWDGPGGWALRGGLGSLGLGAGALLLRRNPLLAAGTAGAALAAGEVRKAGQRRRIQDAGGLLPGSQELATWTEETLLEARLAAGRCGLKPEAAGVPAAEELHQLLAETATEAWSALVERELPAAAEGSLLRRLHLLLDLPVYALGLWIVWKAAVAFLADLAPGLRESLSAPPPGQYVGLDLLVNALILLAVYLFLIRAVVRAVLRRRARQLLATTRRQVAGALASLPRRRRQAAAVRTAPLLGALERLAGLAGKRPAPETAP